MNWHHEAYLAAIVGKKGTGKTTHLLKMIREHKAKNGKKPKYICAFDPKREIALKMKWTVCTTPEQMAAAVKRGIPFAYDYREMFHASEKKEALGFFCRWCFTVFSKLNGVKLVVIDEIQSCTTTHVGGVPKALIEISDEGRREEIDLICVCNKGLNKLSEEIRGQITDLFVFKTTSRGSLKMLEEDFSDEEIETIRNLEKGKYLHAEI